MDEMPTDGFRHRPLWLLGVVALVLAQAGLALSLFGPARTLAALLDDRPVLSGRHPLHLYHGTLGAAAFHDRGATTCYDPNFQAGYPKTPVFDGGCRPAELFLALAGGEYRPAAYKAGLFGCLLLIPLAFVLAARGAGLPAGAAVLAGACGTLLGWSWPVRRLVEEGEFDFLTAGLGVLVFVTWLARYARDFGVGSWAVLAATAAAGWYAHPVVWVGLVPVVVGYYLVYAPRQELAWHLGLAGVTAAGLSPNLWWLTDWGRYWWLRQPSPADTVPLPEWTAVLGTPADYVQFAGYVPWGGLLAAAGAYGLLALWRNRFRGSAALLLVAAGLTVTVARVLAAWPRVPPDAAERLAPLAAAFLALPAVFGLWKVLERGQLAAAAAVVTVAGLLVAGWADGPTRPVAAAARLRTEPLLSGLSTDQQQVLAAVTEHTTAEARILWDETTDQRPGWNWTALLPVLTDRAYLGGLDHDAGMEYSFCGLRDGKLTGRPLGEWTDADLGKFCHWYNVGWVVCRSPAAAERWGRLPMAKPVAQLKEGGQRVVVYALDRPRSFVLAGTAKWESASPTRIALTDVIPDADGKVDLSLHVSPGLRVYPSYIRIHHPDDPARDTAPDPTGRDPINHVRLRVPGPVPRITLVWENP
jgi:hypothetical protein